MEIKPTPIVPINDQLLDEKGIRLLIKREDLNHPIVSGNKALKLKYNLIEARNQGHRTLLTFGGAYSNHIYAVAGAGKEAGFKTIGIIRGEAHTALNPTLSFAKACGMEFHYMDRDTYRKKTSPEVINLLRQQYDDFYLIPEGGTNSQAIKGCAEMASELVQDFDFMCCPVGTGGTITGFIKGLAGNKEVLGFSALKGNFLKKEVSDLLSKNDIAYNNWSINTDYHFGGYAKVKPHLLDFINLFESQHNILLDPVYTGKMLYGLFDLIKSDHFARGTTILTVHTGGLQGRAGFGL